MRALPCTYHRHAVMTMVIEGDIVAIPVAVGLLWRRRVSDLIAPSIGLTTDSLTAQQSRALGELLDAGLVRRSAASDRTGPRRGHRTVIATEAGRDWWMKGPKTQRGCSNGNNRGGSADRRKRRQWLLDTFGNGTTAECSLRTSPTCRRIVDAETISVDRIVPGSKGGTYRRDNIRPACAPCQSRQGAQLGTASRLASV